MSDCKRCDALELEMSTLKKERDILDELHRASIIEIEGLKAARHVPSTREEHAKAMMEIGRALAVVPDRGNSSSREGETCNDRFQRLMAETKTKYERGEAVTWPPLPTHDINCGGSWYAGCSDVDDYRRKRDGR